MFKGLKSKLEDEAKKLQASVQNTVAQYGESLSQQVGQIRTGASDAGSESGSNVSRRFFGANTSNAESSPAASLNYSVGNALMEEVAEGDLLGLDLPPRERRASGGSNHSNESSMSNLFASVPGMASSTLDMVESDLESTVDDHGSAVVRSASKEQISSVLLKLQGRAANYKDKYRDLVKRYNEVVTENNKCRTVLAQTQDKALHRIEKLRNDKKILGEKVKELNEGLHDEETIRKIAKYEEMLKKCTEEIRKNRAKISEITDENEKLKHSVNLVTDEAGVSDLATERVISEWKARVEKLEEEWTERLNKADADSAIALAQAKADMHLALEGKDREVESLRTRCRNLEIQDGQANERWQKRVDDLKELVAALETEKSDMVEKLSEAKIQGVKAVRDEEEKRREELLAEFSSKESQLQSQIEELKTNLAATENKLVDDSQENSNIEEFEKRIEKLEAELKLSNEKVVEKEESEKNYTEKISDFNAKIIVLEQKLRDDLLLKENAENMVEKLKEAENVHAEELKRMRSQIESLEKQQQETDETEENDKNEEVKDLMADVRDLEEKLRDSEDRRKKEMSEMQDVIESTSSKHRGETAMLIKEHEEILNLAREQAETERKILVAKFENAQSTAESLRSSNEVLENRLELSIKEGDQAATKASHEAIDLEREINDVRSKLSKAEAKSAEVEAHLRKVHTEFERVSEERMQFEEELERMRSENEEEEISSSNARTELATEVEELKKMLDERNETVRGLESERESLEVELADVKELASMHEHLRDELQEARRQRDEVEVRVLELQKRAEIAEKQLEEDRTRLAEDRAETERVSSSQKSGSEISLVVEEEIHQRNVAPSESLISTQSAVSSEDSAWGVSQEEFNDVPSTPLANEADSQLLLDLTGAPSAQDIPSNNIIRNDKKLEEKIIELEAILREKENDLSELKIKASETSNTSQLRISELETELEREKENSRAVSDTEKELQQLRDKLTEASQAGEIILAAQNRLEQLDKECVQEKKLKEKSEEEKEKLTLRLADMERDIVESREQLIRVENEKSEVVQAANTHKQVLEKELVELKDSLSELQLEISSSEDKAAAECAKLREEIRIVIEQRELLEKDIKVLREENQLLSDANESNLLERTTLEENVLILQKQKQEYDSLKAELDDSHKEIVEWKEKVESLESQITKSEAIAQTNERDAHRIRELEEKLSELELSERKSREEIQSLHQSSQDKTGESQARIEELDKLVDQMRVEFLEKEKILEELRNEIDNVRKEAKESRDGKAEADILASGLKENLAQLMADISEKENSLSKKDELLLTIQKELEDSSTERETEKKEEEKLRIQYSTALESAKDELSSLKEQLLEGEAALKDKKNIQEQVETLEAEMNKCKSQQQEEIDSAVNEIKRKAENKLTKLRNSYEKEATARKAEFLLQIDELRSTVLEKERLLDDVKIEKTKIEQQLLGEDQTKNELSEEKSKSSELASRVGELERRVSELTASNDSALKECEILRERRRELESTTELLTEQVKSLENANEEGFKRAAVKQDVDGKKMIRELQREVKQLYVELTEKSQALDSANLKIKELVSSESVGNGIEKKEFRLTESSAQDSYMSFEEIESLKKRLADAHREIDEMRETQTKNKGNKARNSNNIPHEDASFAEPTEAEYLRNVLFRYMNERETLGKEIVTLTRVIGTVARFSKPQLESVVAKEENRVASWGQTLQGAVQGTRH